MSENTQAPNRVHAMPAADATPVQVVSQSMDLLRQQIRLMFMDSRLTAAARTEFAIQIAHHAIDLVCAYGDERL